MPLCVLLLHVLVLTISVYADLTQDPIVSLLPRHLVAFYPLLTDSRDYAPFGSTNGFAQDGYSRTIITSKLGARLEQGTGLDFPIPLHSRIFPQLTIGAWVQAGEAMAVNDGWNGSSFGRSMCVMNGTWTVGGELVKDYKVKIDEWSLVAAVLDTNVTYFYMDGKLVEVKMSSKGMASSTLVAGAAVGQTFGGFTGYLKAIFLFDVALSEVELNTLTNAIATNQTNTPQAPPTTLVTDAVVKLEPKLHFYRKDHLQPLVSVRQAVDIDREEYNVALPTVNDAELLSVRLVYAGDIADDTLSPVADAEFTVWSLQPKQRKLHVGSLVTVQGTPMFDEHTSMCRINEDIIFDPIKVTAHSITCQIPELSKQNTIKFDISQNGISYTSLGEFQLLERPIIFRILPVQLIRTFKPQVVDIFGTNFAKLISLSCSIGGVIVPATFLSSSRVQCEVESIRYASLSSVGIDVSVNGVDFSDEPTDLELLSAPSIDRLSPDNGPTKGGTLVEIYGRDFVDNVRYSILTDDVDYVNPNLLRWRTTGANFAESKTLQLRIEGQVYPEITDLQFTYTAAPRISSVFPQTVPVWSETVLAISGNGFGDFSNLSCSFVKVTSTESLSNSSLWLSNAAFKTSSILQCPTPKLSEPGLYAVSVSNNAQDFSLPSNGVRITVYNELLLESASVLAGPATGGTNVDVIGKNFVNSTNVACRFGESQGRAVFISILIIRCISPAWAPEIGSYGLAPVALRIALNGLDFSNSSLLFQYYAPPMINTIFPWSISINSTLSLTLSGNYLVSFGGVICRIGPSLLIPGIVRNGGRLVQCATHQTPFTPGMVEASVSLNGGNDFTLSRVNLLVHEPIIIRNIDMPYIAKNVTSSITVRGQGFIKGIATKCAFGDLLTNASVITPELLTCPIPSTISRGHDYELRISLNNGYQSSSSVGHVYVYDLPSFNTVSLTFLDHMQQIHVRGSGFVLNESFSLAIECRLDDFARVTARVNNGSSLYCVVPEMESNGDDFRNVRLSFQIGPSIISTDLSFTYAYTPTFVAQDPGDVPGRMILDLQAFNSSLNPVMSHINATILPNSHLKLYDISPKIVERGKAINITVHGHDFIRARTFCHFSSNFEPILAVVTSPAFALCAFDDARAETGSVTLALSLERVRPSIATAAFALIDAPKILSIYPRRGPLQGGTKVVVTGTDFANNVALYCHFDEQAQVSATRLTAMMLECLTPRSYSGRNAKDMPYLISMSPSFGSVEGGTIVNFYGRWLNVSDDFVVCTFGTSQATNVVIINSTSVIATSPSSFEGAGKVSVKCTLDGEAITPVDWSYDYLLSPWILSVTPQLGLESSSTQILVQGTGFSTKYPMICQIGNHASPAIVQSSFQVKCVAPPHTFGLVYVSVTFDGIPFRNSSIVFEYLAEPILLQVIPPLGSETGVVML
ncbi:Plexins (functional semaphorin receptors) [Plasmopara halstedii]|uniref:Plexins (Functional semaphorin receptors) n=1 Tax=Plasmopara halstedii TaxID=4781 RepID=A0A0P1AVT8_PLAHL|nr:Plexins (functional semaphorin receptors) [Plasmopara halstedii]CEG46461.1 Plexins (functional semaphorin receptors) [Plasmopara halstedii]|eukprot:XP_024582830.1 Plexins (functional semaphorin receptors) [Plasmopara halstedii]